jgi:hypothetical protein
MKRRMAEMKENIDDIECELGALSTGKQAVGWHNGDFDSYTLDAPKD